MGEAIRGTSSVTGYPKTTATRRRSSMTLVVGREQKQQQAEPLATTARRALAACRRKSLAAILDAAAQQASVVGLPQQQPSSTTRATLASSPVFPPSLASRGGLSRSSSTASPSRRRPAGTLLGSRDESDSNKMSMSKSLHSARRTTRTNYVRRSFGALTVLSSEIPPIVDENEEDKRWESGSPGTSDKSSPKQPSKHAWGGEKNKATTRNSCRSHGEQSTGSAFTPMRNGGKLVDSRRISTSDVSALTDVDSYCEDPECASEQELYAAVMDPATLAQLQELFLQCEEEEEGGGSAEEEAASVNTFAVDDDIDLELLRPVCIDDDGDESTVSLDIENDLYSATMNQSCTTAADGEGSAVVVVREGKRNQE